MTKIHGNKRYPRLPAQQSIRVFEAAARHLNFTKAGDELALTQSGVSKQIKGLETFLGVALFIREGHHLVLSEAGKQFHNRCGQALDILQLGVNEIQGSQNQLRLQVPPTFAARWLIPRMGQLRQAQPDLDLHIETTWLRTIHDKIQIENAELVMHVSKGYSSHELMVEPLRREWLCVLASPAYLDKSGPIKSAHDLKGQTLIHTRLDGHIHWQAWAEICGCDGFDVSQGYEFETLDMALSAAENGIGLVVCDLFYAIQALSEGTLIIPFKMPILLGLDYVLLAQSHQVFSKPQNHYRDWLKQAMVLDEARLEEVLRAIGLDPDDKRDAFAANLIATDSAEKGTRKIKSKTFPESVQ